MSSFEPYPNSLQEPPSNLERRPDAVPEAVSAIFAIELAVAFSRISLTDEPHHGINGGVVLLDEAASDRPPSNPDLHFCKQERNRKELHLLLDVIDALFFGWGPAVPYIEHHAGHLFANAFDAAYEEGHPDPARLARQRIQEAVATVVARLKDPAFLRKVASVGEALVDRGVLSQADVLRLINEDGVVPESLKQLEIEPGRLLAWIDREAATCSRAALPHCGE